MAPKLNLAVIDMEKNNGLGQVLTKDEAIVRDTLEFGKITACRHANGRDWWILVAVFSSNRYYRILLDPDGPRLMGIQAADPESTWWGSDGQACFSPDGTKYAMLHQTFFAVPDTLRIYDFDRCTGLLSNGKMYRQPKDSTFCGGLAFSPDSRYLYHAFCDRMFQYDMRAPDLAASRQVVAWNDGFRDPLYNSFYKMQLAPDGRIYMSSNNGSHHMHRIDHPNRAGEASGVCQHCVYLPGRNFTTIPNMPNYRLGPVDGSACDTLGINNVPLAGWRHESWGLGAEFTSVSWFEPETWLWDFGDGGTSSDTNALHNYNKPGIYTVCLTVRNQHGSNTLCRDVNITTLPAHEPAAAPGALAIWPNPAGSELFARAPAPVEGRWLLSDFSGRAIRSGHWSGDVQRIDLQGLVPGMYLLSLLDEAGRRMAGKVVVE